jgi:glycerol-3-phosphate acyltransferase PlsX
MNIAIDTMGGDFAPGEVIKAIQLYLSDSDSPAYLLLTGEEHRIRTLLQENEIPSQRVKIIDAPEVIGMNEHPTKALKAKPRSSISAGFQLLASGKADAFLSAGNTGAMLVGALHSLKAIKGVQRPVISTIIPKENGSTGLLVDVGINADCKAENLNQFALLGSLYAQHILGIQDPRVGLINIGEEEGKGNLLAQAAFPLLQENRQIHFIGNIEGRDILLDKADVMVCEGFTGNIILKLAESIYEITQRKGIHHEYFDRFNFEIYGGTPVLGVSKPVIIGHGISHAMAFRNMIAIAEKIINTDLLGKMQASFDRN